MTTLLETLHNSALPQLSGIRIKGIAASDGTEGMVVSSVDKACLTERQLELSIDGTSIDIEAQIGPSSNRTPNTGIFLPYMTDMRSAALLKKSDPVGMTFYTSKLDGCSVYVKHGSDALLIVHDNALKDSEDYQTKEELNDDLEYLIEEGYIGTVNIDDLWRKIHGLEDKYSKYGRRIWCAHRLLDDILHTKLKPIKHWSEYNSKEEFYHIMGCKTEPNKWSILVVQEKGGRFNLERRVDYSWPEE